MRFSTVIQNKKFDSTIAANNEKCNKPDLF